MTRPSVGTLAIVCACVSAPRVTAQSAPTVPPPARFEVGIGPVWIGHTNVGTRDATETAAAGSRFVLFSTSTQLDAAVGIEGRIGIHVSRVLEVDVAASYSPPMLRSRITADVENANPTSAGVAVRQIAIGGSLVVHLTRLHVSRRVVPFIEAGAGYLRQLYDTRTVAATGQTYQIGGGVNYMLASRTGHRVTGLGLRADVRALARTKGVAPDGRAHVAPAAGASLFVGF